MFGTTGADYINNSKIIYGTYGAGIYTEAKTNLINSGTITGTGTGSNATSGIILRDGGSVNNSVLIAASTTLNSSANAAGIYISGEAGITNNITNTGAIRGNNAIVVDPRYNATGPVHTRLRTLLIEHALTSQNRNTTLRSLRGAS